MKRALIVIVCMMVLISSSAVYVYASENKVGSGIEYSAKSIFSIPREIAKESEKSNIINGVIVGGAKGIVGTASNAFKGLMKILTFYNSN